MTTITIDDELQSRFQAVAAPEEDVIALAKAAMTEFIARRERAAEHAVAQAEAQSVFNGPRRLFSEADADFRRRHGLSAQSSLSADELAEEAERIIAAMSPKVRAAMEREGLL